MGRAFAFSIAAMALLAPAAAAAQEWPTKPVKVINGFQPGGPTDLLARILGEHLHKTLGQPFVVESKPGASGVVAGQALIAAPADGYTIYVVSFGVMVTARAMYASMTYDPATAFAPVTTLVRSPMLLEVSVDTPVKTFKEFATWAKANESKLNHGSPGAGTQPHLAAELLRLKLGFNSQHIPYRGVAPYAQGMAQREVQWAFDSPNTGQQLLKGGHIRLLAVSTDTRWPTFPDAPTLIEAGIADASWPNWFGLVTAAGVPKPIIDKLAAETAKGFQLPEVAERIRNAGYEPWTMKPEEMSAFLERERSRWVAVVKENNIKVE
ncbi:MAG: Bug family tripartite tricarboxylate transporter substrate binding protein [Rhodospirillaceae bacterium]